MSKKFRNETPNRENSNFNQEEQADKLMENHAALETESQPVKIIGQENSTYNGKNLPKNFRQIGEPDDRNKIYIEDYVMTYIKQIAAYANEKERVLILYGKYQQVDRTNYYFVSGAVAVEEINSCLYNVLFNQEDWKNINQQAAIYFPTLSVLGWALLRQDEGDSFDYRISGTHEEFFRKGQQVYFEYSISEKEENAYLYIAHQMRKQRGYYIYYDKNPLMQNYMVCLKQENNAVEKEDEQVDRAAKQFRTVVQEKKERVKKQRTTALYYATASVLIMVIMLIGITMLNNYEKMQNMEVVLNQIADNTKENEKIADVSNVENTESTNANILDETKTDSETDIESDTNLNEDLNNDSQMGGNKEKIIDDNVIAQNDDAEIAADDEIVPANATPSEPIAELSKTEENNKEDGEEENANAQSDTGNEDNKEIGQAASGEGDEKEDVAQSSDSDSGEAKKGEGTGDEEAVETSAKIKTTSIDGIICFEYIIKRGDTLEKIVGKQYGNTNKLKEVCQINNIENPDQICYGEKIFLPE